MKSPGFGANKRIKIAWSKLRSGHLFCGPKTPQRLHAVVSVRRLECYAFAQDETFETAQVGAGVDQDMLAFCPKLHRESLNFTWKTDMFDRLRILLVPEHRDSTGNNWDLDGLGLECRAKTAWHELGYHSECDRLRNSTAEVQFSSPACSIWLVVWNIFYFSIYWE